MSFQIYSIIWPYIIKFCAFKLTWIFAFVVVCISSFIVIVVLVKICYNSINLKTLRNSFALQYKNQMEELKNCVFYQDPAEVSCVRKLKNKCQLEMSNYGIILKRAPTSHCKSFDNDWERIRSQ
ncbi:uncharacterized protein LOC106658294 [Trichogramma pretiosum]|uniref:uncharacterized protein LOC106658294 n=1 Tax=Trichogramma pretiosum TaxID=7493 RepID=UPI0006C98983|nr:uncharacterized protein LOC106658294 [Trichogramma pretiosum]